MRPKAYILIVFILTFALAIGNTFPTHAASLPLLRRVNVPHFPQAYIDDFWVSMAAIFWFGQVTPSENYADVRVAYSDYELVVHVSIFDRRVWYNTDPSSDSLTNWDAVTLYLDKDGNIGTAPDARSYRLDAQTGPWETPRTSRQAAYMGNGTSWISATIPFTTVTAYRGSGGPNTDADNRGWYMTYYIPFTSLGLSGPPPEGQVWGTAIVLHDRDAAPPAAMSPDQKWPETMNGNEPVTWEQLAFGIPTYIPPSAVPSGSATIRQGLNGAVVTDVAAGGHSTCGDGLDFWTEWGVHNYAGYEQFNVQDQIDVADWPCFSKYYVTFPLGALPSSKIIISATVTLHQFGNAGQGPGGVHESSYIQALSVGEDWDEATLNWNNAPLARENITGTWVEFIPAQPTVADVIYRWNVSRAVAEAYSAGQPLRLAFYSADMPQDSGRYFWTSDAFGESTRPMLTVAWGEPGATLRKTVSSPVASYGQPVTFTLGLMGSGSALTLTDNLPILLSAPGPIRLEGNGTVTYNTAARQISWTGTPTLGQQITVTFPVTVLASNTAVIRNTAVLTDAAGSVWTDTATVIAYAHQVWLPLILHN